MRVQVWEMQRPFVGGSNESGRFYVAFITRRGELFDPEIFGENLPLSGFGIVEPPGPEGGFGNITTEALESANAEFDHESRVALAGDNEAFASILEFYMSIFVRVDTTRDTMDMITTDHMRDLIMYCPESVVRIVEFEEGDPSFELDA